MCRACLPCLLPLLPSRVGRTPKGWPSVARRSLLLLLAALLLLPSRVGRTPKQGVALRCSPLAHRDQLLAQTSTLNELK